MLTIFNPEKLQELALTSAFSAGQNYNTYEKITTLI